MAGKFSATATSAAIIAANRHRTSLTIQNYSDSADAINLGVDKAAVADEGLRLEPGESLRLSDERASRAIYAICPTSTAGGGWE